MNIILRRISLENFKGCRSLETDFSQTTSIYGDNETGKTTLADAFSWLLFGKDSLGKSDFDIRPLDKNNKPIDFIDITVSAEIEIDGTAVTLKKEQKQKWTKPRGRQEQVFSGNVNEYEIDGYPKSEKEYKEHIASVIDERIFQLITSPTTFTARKWQEQRTALLALIPEITNESVLELDESFAIIADEIQNVNSDQMKAKYAKELKRLKKNAEDIPVRIDEVNKSLQTVSETDIKDAEKEKAQLLETIEKARKQIVDSESACSEYRKTSDEILKLEAEKARVKNETSLMLEQQKAAIRNAITEQDNFYKKAHDAQRSLEIADESARKEMDTRKEAIEGLVAEYKETKARSFGDNCCPYCKQLLPDHLLEEEREDFENKKAEELDRIEQLGNKSKKRIGELQEELKESAETLEKLKSTKIDCNKKRNALSVELSGLPDQPVMPDGYAKIEESISDLKKQLETMDNGEEYRSNIRNHIAECEEKIKGIDLKLAVAEQNKAAEKRIDDLQAELKENSGNIANVEKILFTVEKFIKSKMDMLSNRINDKFSVVKWKLFKEQINGGMTECCECTINGVPFSSGLNYAGRIQAGLDIINTLSGFYHCTAPVWIDNRESISVIPTLEGQVINLIVSENDKELRIEREGE